ncbi:MAG: hypothetical protein CL739_00135 [Chloroflexi bacterium]|nr:hypothetical protein [Chloroflexota bacterium]
MTEPNLSVSNKSWNPAKKEFWETNPDIKINLLIAMGFIGLLLSFIGWWWVYIWNWITHFDYPFEDRLAGIQALLLFMIVIKGNRPNQIYRVFLVILLLLSCVKILMTLIYNWFWYIYTDEFFTVLNALYDLMNGLLLAIATFLLLKLCNLEKGGFWNSERFLIFVFSILIIRVIYDFGFALVLNSTLERVLIQDFGSIIFWSSFSLIYVYRTDIKPWKKDIRIPNEKKSGTIDVYTANKLLEAKELLDKGIITMDEFLEIKGEHMGSKGKVDEPVVIIQDSEDIEPNDKESKKIGSSTKIEELKELAKMKKEGLITDKEYQKMKKEIID